MEQGVQTKAHMIELLAPMEELLTVAVEDTPDTFF
jgi:hypothetical protein